MALFSLEQNGTVICCLSFSQICFVSFLHYREPGVPGELAEATTATVPVVHNIHELRVSVQVRLCTLHLHPISCKNIMALVHSKSLTQNTLTLNAFLFDWTLIL